MQDQRRSVAAAPHEDRGLAGVDLLGGEVIRHRTVNVPPAGFVAQAAANKQRLAPWTRRTAGSRMRYPAGLSRPRSTVAERAHNWRTPVLPETELLTAQFRAQRFAPHWHDTYNIPIVKRVLLHLRGSTAPGRNV
jgi:hypothetical protein